MLSLRRLYEAILGKGTNIAEVAGNENAYLAENRMSSVNVAEQHEYYVRYAKPLLEAIAKIVGTDKNFNKYSVENACFHENIYSYFLRNSSVEGIRDILDRYWEISNKTEEFQRFVESIKKAYDKNQQKEENFVFRFARAMEKGDFSKVLPYLRDEDIKLIDDMLFFTIKTVREITNRFRL